MKKITWADVDDLEIEITSALIKFIDNDDKVNEMMREISLSVRRMMIRWLTEEEQEEGESE
jgi:phage terminase Nu1 subunit (DNA packaging protein)